jgi:hypothetical protein
MGDATAVGAKSEWSVRTTKMRRIRQNSSRRMPKPPRALRELVSEHFYKAFFKYALTQVLIPSHALNKRKDILKKQGLILSMLHNSKLVHPVHKRVALVNNTFELTANAGDEFIACKQVAGIYRKAFGT